VAEGNVSHVCVISGCGPTILSEARELGAEHIFSKPLDVGRLMGVLAAAPVRQR